MVYDRRLLGAVPAAAAAGGALGAVLLLGGAGTLPVTAQDTAALTQQQHATATSLEGAFTRINDVVQPATVSIMARTRAAGEAGVPPGGDLPFSFPGLPPRGGDGGSGRASGSGVVVRPNGYILTNDHVVAGAQDNRVKVTLNDGTEQTGQVFRDPRSDLAIVKIDAPKPLPFVRLADSSQLRVGQWAIAIGSPFGQRGTMTAGIVSALHRKTGIGQGGERRVYPNLIQTDASINPGNSGGPLLNINGELIGVNVAIYSPSGANAGIGFAIPANTAKAVMDQLINKGRVVRGSLGVMPNDILPGLRQRLGVDKGAYIDEVTPDGPAAAAGIEPGDVVTRFDNREIVGESGLRDAIGATAPGSRIAVTLLRDQRPRTVSVVLGTLEDLPVEAGPSVPARRPIVVLGLDARPLTGARLGELKLDADVKGVLVGGVQPGGPADDAGLAPGSIIVAMNSTPITSVDALNRAIVTLKSGEIVTLAVLRVREAGKASRAVVNIMVP